VFVEGAEESADLYEGLRRVLAQVNDLIDHVRVARDQEAASAARAELERVAKYLARLGRRLHEDRRASPITRAERLGSD
jgi:CRP-like cAMP-binding protein